ncbi:MAG: hypothetical protein ACRDOI_07620 [Trebonia sp.]
MKVAVRVSATVTGHRRRGVREHDLVLALPPGEVTARQLIEAAVAAEVTAFQARAEEASLVRVLTTKSLDADLVHGAVRTGGPRDAAGAPAGEPNLPEAVDAALLAFGDGLFKIFVGERELTDGAALPVPDGAALLFLRLVPLAGG